MSGKKVRPGDQRLPFDPAAAVPDAGLVFIGRIRSPWPDLDACPKNLREARERGGGGAVELDPPWRPGLQGLQAGATLLLLYWMDRAPRDLIVQAPAHRPAPAGTFALRSPARPNPIALAAVRLLDIDMPAGRLHIDAIDCLDGTPLLDIKPWLPGVDLPSGAQSPA
ncbi:MAG: SAM-dependent methyltransferase [Sneathiellaceae bacterium]